MTIPATIARSAAATITGTSGRRGRRGPPEASAGRRSPSIVVAGSSYGSRPGPSTRVASGSAAAVAHCPAASAMAAGRVGGGVERRGAYQESQGVDSGCGQLSGRGRHRRRQCGLRQGGDHRQRRRRRLRRRGAAGGLAAADRAEQKSRLHRVPACRVTVTSYTGHSHSRLDHASALANRNGMTAPLITSCCYRCAHPW